MSVGYRAVGWNRQKKVYDRVLLGSVAAFLALFVGVGFAVHPFATAETMVLRAFGTAALVLLHAILSIGPLARLDRRFLPLLYNRRHMGVTMFVLALVHGAFALVQFHALGDTNPLVSVLVSNTRFGSLTAFPFQPLGVAALLILFAMAATSHDFWLANLSAPVWKALHMLVYVAYALVVMHVALGVLQAETSPALAALLGLGLAWILALHVAAGLREARLDGAQAARGEWVDVCAADDIPEGRAVTALVAGDRVAVFRYDGLVSAVSNACQHQNGPLGEGRVIDGCITCPWHGYQYLPGCGRSPEPFTERIPTFPVRVVDGRVQVASTPLPAGTDTPPAPVAEGADGARAGSGRRAPEGEGRDDFYVGYLPDAPPGLARWTRARVVGLVLGVLALVPLLVVAQNPFSRAAFEFGRERAFTGTVVAEPYPTLVVARPGSPVDAPGASRYLLVAFGKHGADERVRELDGRTVTVTGTLIYRDDRTMIEVASIAPADGVPPGSAPAAGGAPEDLGEHTYVGEIVDSKCFLGVMKPGHTKPHRACAVRCISGGIPPVLLVRDREGRAACFLLTSASGAAVNRDVLDLVAEPVEITGRVLRHGDLLELRADPAGYRRID